MRVMAHVLFYISFDTGGQCSYLTFAIASRRLTFIPDTVFINVFQDQYHVYIPVYMGNNDTCIQVLSVGNCLT